MKNELPITFCSGHVFFPYQYNNNRMVPKVAVFSPIQLVSRATLFRYCGYHGIDETQWGHFLIVVIWQ